MYEHNSNLSVKCVSSIWNNKDYAVLLSDELNRKGLNSQIINLINIKHQSNAVGIIGADAIDVRAGVINGYPSKDFAQRLKYLQIPLFVVAESFKYGELATKHDGFDLVDANLITNIFTSEISFKLSKRNIPLFQ